MSTQTLVTVEIVPAADAPLIALLEALLLDCAANCTPGAERVDA